MKNQIENNIKKKEFEFFIYKKSKFENMLKEYDLTKATNERNRYISGLKRNRPSLIEEILKLESQKREIESKIIKYNRIEKLLEDHIEMLEIDMENYYFNYFNETPKPFEIVQDSKNKVIIENIFKPKVKRAESSQVIK